MDVTAALIALMVVAAALPVMAAPVVSREGDLWRLENEALRVDVDANAGRYTVLDKAADYLWRGPDEGQRPETRVAIPQARQAPAVNADLADWGEQGARVAITPRMVTDGAPPANAADLSGTLRVLWDNTGLWLGLEVADNTLVFPAPDETQWWHRDSVEFWLNGNQYALRFGEWGVNVWSARGDAGDARAAFRRTDGGYVVEVWMPAALLGEAITRGVGGQVRLAVGINDCDAEVDGRKSQLYWPASWVHSNTDSFAVATLADAEGNVPAAAPETGPALTPVAAPEGEAVLMFRGTMTSAGREYPVTYTFALEGEGPELLLTVTADDPEQATGGFAVLHPLVLDRPGGRLLGARYNNGIGVPTDDLTWAGQTWTTYGTLDMPWIGLTDGTLGYMLLWELPVSCDNGAARFERVVVGDRTLLAPAVHHHAVKGTFAAPRTVRYSFTQDGGHVSICKRYRDYAIRNGILVTQREKMRTKPDIARQAGAPVIWGRSDLRFCREAKAAGIERMLVNAPQSREDMEAIKALGYLMSVYDNYEDAHEGDDGRYGDFVQETDVLINADGSQMKAWLTRSDPPKQFMKRCAALYERVARVWVPRELERYPYNARFIDVTTATGLKECYSETHGLTRTEDREVKRNLVRYIGEELNLVLGGEHGRWWGADMFNYWEGMQSGGFYSWPAGYVGRDLPETREDIGERYLEWGLGERNRYPLWELVFHDCVVSTWYWGDTTGHLHQVAPELGYKKDAFNILYGTVPMYWVNRPYSYNWSVPELRARLLESYRNTCKLHEQIAFEELVGHEFVTEDRAVQSSRFGDGTQVWVNFGEAPWTLQFEGRDYVLPQYGFFAQGPRIRQYRTIEGGREVTFIQSPGYCHVEGAETAVVEADAPVTLREQAPGRVLINHADDGAPLTVRPAQLDATWPEGLCRVLTLDEEGLPLRFIASEMREGAVAFTPPAGATASLLVGPQVLREVADLGLTGEVGATAVGRPVSLDLALVNNGLRAAADAQVAVYADAVREDRLVAQERLAAVAPGATVELTLEVPAGVLDGERRLIVLVDHPAGADELVRADNRWDAGVYVPPDLTRWAAHVDLTVALGEVSRSAPVVETPFDVAAEWGRAGGQGAPDPAALRVAVLQDDGQPGHFVPAQYVADPEGARLVWVLPGEHEAGAVVVCRVFMDGAEPRRHLAHVGGWWDEETQTVTTPAYSVRFEEGYIRGITSLRAGKRIIGNMGVSSQATGWVNEQGEVESFEVLSEGPVMAQVRVNKNLDGGHHYDKLYTFYPAHFLVTTLSLERFGALSRSYYVAECRFEDDKGNTALIDGKGDAEDVAGKNPGPKWYATWADDWALSCVAVTRHDNITYWDAGAWAGVGFTTGRGEPATLAYFLHDPTAQGFAAPDFAALDHERTQTAVEVGR